MLCPFTPCKGTLCFVFNSFTSTPKPMNLNSHQQPEFLIDFLPQFFGFPVGRLYLPATFTRPPQFQLWRNSVYIPVEKLYLNGDEVIWFIASIEEYERLAAKFPHHKYCEHTQSRLSLLSTIVSLLKPSSRLDYTEVCSSPLFLSLFNSRFHSKYKLPSSTSLVSSSSLIRF